MSTPNTDTSCNFYQEADYILNHYDRNSHADKLCLAKKIEKLVNDGICREREAHQKTRQELATSLENQVKAMTKNARLCDIAETAIAELADASDRWMDGSQHAKIFAERSMKLRAELEAIKSK